MTKDWTEVFSVSVLLATLMVTGLSLSFANSSSDTPLMAEVTLLLVDSIAMPSMVYLAFCAGVPLS
ncbi:hypothetical protein D3C85_1237620 [compost metagenome]